MLEALSAAAPVAPRCDARSCCHASDVESAAHRVLLPLDELSAAVMTPIGMLTPMPWRVSMVGPMACPYRRVLLIVYRQQNRYPPQTFKKLLPGRPKSSSPLPMSMPWLTFCSYQGYGMPLLNDHAVNPSAAPLAQVLIFIPVVCSRAPFLTMLFKRAVT